MKKPVERGTWLVASAVPGVVILVMRALFGGPRHTAAQWVGMAVVGVLSAAALAVLAAVARRRRLTV